MKNLLLLMFLSISTVCFSQVKVIQFNANWNSANSVKWLSDLSDCSVDEIDIATNKAAQSKYKIVVVPTIIVFNHGEEVKRYQADLSFTMLTTRKEIQDYIDELIISKF
jgi:hypothetical protein